MKQDGLFKILLPSSDITLDQPPSYACFFFFLPLLLFLAMIYSDSHLLFLMTKRRKSYYRSRRAKDGGLAVRFLVSGAKY